MNIPDTTGHHLAIYVTSSPNVCFCTTWGKQNKQNITFLINAKCLCSRAAHFNTAFQFLCISRQCAVLCRRKCVIS